LKLIVTPLRLARAARHHLRSRPAVQAKRASGHPRWSAGCCSSVTRPAGSF